jgi:hypothetical protein
MHEVNGIIWEKPIQMSSLLVNLIKTDFNRKSTFKILICFLHFFAAQTNTQKNQYFIM